MVSCGLLSSKSLRNHHPIHTSSDLSQLAGWPRGQVVIKWVIWFDPIILRKLQGSKWWSMMIHHLLPTCCVSINMLCFYTKFPAFWWLLFRKNTKTKEKHIWNLMMCHHSLPFFSEKGKHGPPKSHGTYWKIKARLQGTAVQQTQQTNPWVGSELSHLWGVMVRCASSIRIKEKWT